MKILFCIHIHLRTIRAVATWCWLVCSTNLVILMTTEGRLEKSRGFASPPSPLMESLIKKAPIVLLPFFPFSFLETGWLYQNGISLLGYPVLQMIII